MNRHKLTQFIIILILAVLVSPLAKAQSALSNSQIRFTTFSVSMANKKIAINWATDHTVQTNYFEIQKSLDGINFKTIALVLGPDPKQLSCECYGCYDKYISKTAKHSYYRLKHVSVTGEEQISETKQLAKI